MSETNGVVLTQAEYDEFVKKIRTDARIQALQEIELFFRNNGDAEIADLINHMARRSA